jgi:phosphatidylglycerophosphate synthase
MSEPKYSYESAQDSVLLPYYRRYAWNAILNLLPASLSPNAMTVISTACCFTSFLLASLLGIHPVALVAAALLVLVYLTLDNLDGAHARRIGHSTRLGEFLDHWLDTLNNGFVMLGACLAAGLTSGLTLWVLSAGTLAFFSVQWELRQTGVFRMGRVADIEGNTTVALLYLSLALLGRDFFASTPIPGAPSIAVAIGVGVAGQALWTVFSAISRVSHGRRDFAQPVIAHLSVLAWAGLGGLDPRVALSIAFFLNPVFTNAPVCERLLGHTTPRLDRAVVIGLASCTLLGISGIAPALSRGLATAALLCVAAVTLKHFSSAFTQLRAKAPIPI